MTFLDGKSQPTVKSLASVSASLANGSRGIIMNIVLDPREPSQPLPTNIRQLLYPPAAIYFQPLQARRIHLDGLPLGIIPVFPSSKSFRLNGDAPVTVKCTQYPVAPAYAFTDYKAQGQTMESVIVDLGKPPTGRISGFNAYVALSRGRGRPTIRLLRPYDHKLFTVHPDEKLREEDIRLATLQDLTLDRYNAGEFNIV
ncbi:hypothetical protein V8E53_003706 [Lactarius tabidus]